MLPPAIVLAVVGLVIGSFLNVCIARLPERRNIWRPGSSCPACGTRIALRDNIPVLSFVALRGRCRACGSRIAWRYPVVEIVTSGLFVLTFVRAGWSAELPVALGFLSTLVVISGIDLACQIIPDAVTLPGIVLGFLANLVTGHVGWLESLLGIVVGGGIFFVIIHASRIFYAGQEGMGGGDMKLGAMLGAFLGWRITLVSLLIAVLAGGAAAAALIFTKTRGRKDAVPFGPFLALGGAAGMLWGETLLAWYLGSFQS